MKKKELKAEIENLKEQIDELVLNPDSCRSFMIKQSVKMRQSREATIWQGMPFDGGKLNQFTGIVNTLQTPIECQPIKETYK